MGRPRVAGKNHKRVKALSRIDLVRKRLFRLPCSSILVSDPVDAAYISGFVSSNVALLMDNKKCRLFTDFRYRTEATEFCAAHPQWTLEFAESSLLQKVASCLKKGDVVGFQADWMTVNEYKRLKKFSRGVRYSDCGSVIKELLQVKLPEEISSIRKAARIGDSAFGKLLSDIRPGVTEETLARQLESYCADAGSEKPSFDTIVLFGSRCALPHGKPGSTKLKKGDFVLVDFGCTVGGFASDMTRTVVCGKASPRQRSVYQTVFDAQRYAREHAKANMSCSTIDALARDRIAAAGFGEHFGHALGHGVGRRIHEDPRISHSLSSIVPVDSVVTIEPGIYIPGFGGVRIEDTVVMKDGGVVLLTRFRRELLEL